MQDTRPLFSSAFTNGLVMVLNQHPTWIRLDPRSQSRLNCQTLEFQSYSTQQLIDILEKRVEPAFRPGTVPDEVIETIAEYTAENSGDCRQALETLLRAGRKADKQNTPNASSKLIENLIE